LWAFTILKFSYELYHTLLERKEIRGSRKGIVEKGRHEKRGRGMRKDGQKGRKDWHTTSEFIEPFQYIIKIKTEKIKD